MAAGTAVIAWMICTTPVLVVVVPLLFCGPRILDSRTVSAWRPVVHAIDLVAMLLAAVLTAREAYPFWWLVITLALGALIAHEWDGGDEPGRGRTPLTSRFGHPGRRLGRWRRGSGW